jgi:hypothetical protein
VAGYNELLVGRYNRMLQKLLSMKGPAALTTLSGELVPSLVFSNGVENRYLESWERFATTVNVPVPLAGNQAAFMLRNPTGSNVVAVFEKIAATNNASGFGRPVLQRATGLADLGTIVSLSTNRVPDNRQRPSPTLIGSQSIVAAGTGNSMMSGGFAANNVYDFIFYENQEIPLLPNENLQLIENVLAQGITVTFVWRERLLEESERV